MRILSFTNLPLPAVSEHLGNSSSQLQGWVEGLRVAFKQYSDVELGYASASPANYFPFKSENACYYNIRQPAYHRFPRAWLDQWRHDIDFPNAIEQCLCIIDEYKPDIIHINGTEGLFGSIQSHTKIPVVISLQGLLTVIQRRFFGGFEPVDLLKTVVTKGFINGGGLIHQYWTMKKAAVREIEFVKNGRFFIGRTTFDHDFVKLYNPAANYFYCQEALRPEFYLAQWEIDDAVPNTIYCVAAPNPYKGIDCLLESIALIKMENADIRLNVSGSFTNSGLWPWIKRKIDLLGITDNINWLGLSSPQDIVREMKSAALFVHPSYIDNSPNSLAEAMLVGMPCIASYVGGIPSMITNEDNGLLSPAGDPFSLAGKIKRILSDKPFAVRLAAKARVDSRKRHDPQKVAETMLKIYKEIYPIA